MLLRITSCFNCAALWQTNEYHSRRAFRVTHKTIPGLHIFFQFHFFRCKYQILDGFDLKEFGDASVTSKLEVPPPSPVEKLYMEAS